MSKMSWGPNLLIKQGAKLVQEWNDVTVELEAEDRRRLVDQCRNQLNLKDNSSDELLESPFPHPMETGRCKAMAQRVLAQLAPRRSRRAAGQLNWSRWRGRSPSEIIATLFELELAGLVRQLPGKSFISWVWAD